MLAVNSTLRNVVFFISDDFRPSSGAYGNTYARTPHLDRLAKEGTLFRAAHVQFAYCAPSRNSFMSGRVPDRTGISVNPKSPLSFRDECRGGENCSAWTTMPGHFKKAGYITLGGGKTFHPRAKKDDKSYMDGADSWDLDKVMARPF